MSAQSLSHANLSGYIALNSILDERMPLYLN